MYTTTQTNAQNLNPAIPAQHLLLVPLAQLRSSSRNVRKTGTASIPALASSIERVGLLQNLTVTLARDGEHYEVVAGSRRLAALKLLAKRKRLDRSYEVPCLCIEDASARTASLTENVQREAMHPADQFEAFAALIGEGRSIEDIAADFGVTPLVVQRRLKLANVSPRLLADYRSNDVNLDQLMAVAITDDHAAQEEAFYDAPDWQRSPQALRERLTEREIDARHHPLVRFIGLESYEAAGGGSRRDLFADDQQGVYLTDPVLLERLARERLDAAATELQDEGWAWVQAVPSITYAELQLFQHAPQEARSPRAREAKRMARLEAKLAELESAFTVATDDGDEESAERLQEEGARLADQLDALQAGLREYSATVRGIAGAIVTVSRHGALAVHRGLLREEDAKAPRVQDSEDDRSGAQPVTKARLSEKLVRQLSAHRTACVAGRTSP